MLRFHDERGVGELFVDVRAAFSGADLSSSCVSGCGDVGIEGGLVSVGAEWIDGLSVSRVSKY